MKNRIRFILASCFFLSATSQAQIGASLSTILLDKDPQNARGYRVAAWYQPPCWIWKYVEIFFDASYAHYRISYATPHRSISIYAIAPYIRYYPTHTYLIDPFVQASIGPAYLSATRFGKQNLGMHFAFQDQVGIGALIGKTKRFSVALNAMHYSNGSLCSHNSGITIPIMLNIAYAFV